MSRSRARTVLRFPPQILICAVLALTSCAGPAAPTPSAPAGPPISRPTSPAGEAAPTATYPLEPVIIPPAESESGLAEFVEPIPPVFSSVACVGALGDLILAGDTSGTVSVFSLADPARPRLLSQFNLGTETYQESVLLQGVLDVVQQTHAVEIRAFRLGGDRLYVLTKSTLQVIDLGDPAAPTWLGSLDLGPRANDLRVSGSEVAVLVADTLYDTLRLDLIEAHDPQAMRLIAQSLLPGATAARARFADEIVYLTDRQAASAPDLALYSVADPAAPAFVGSVAGLPAFRAWLADGLAYIATGQLDEIAGLGVTTERASLEIVDLSDPAQPAPLGALPLDEIAIDLAVVGDMLVVVLPAPAGAGELLAVDRSHPSALTVLRTVPLAGEPQAVAYAAGHVYLAAGPAGILVVDPIAGAVVASITAADLVSP